VKADMTTEQYRATLLKEWTEADFQEHIVSLAKSLGWTVAWFRNVRIQRANGTTFYQLPVAADGKGWPDLILCRGTELLFCELKRENGVLEPAQKEWRDRLLAAQARWYCWKPRDLDFIEAVLA
jgi:hypothetical protein